MDSDPAMKAYMAFVDYRQRPNFFMGLKKDWYVSRLRKHMDALAERDAGVAYAEITGWMKDSPELSGAVLTPASVKKVVEDLAGCCWDVSGDEDERKALGTIVEAVAENALLTGAVRRGLADEIGKSLRKGYADIAYLVSFALAHPSTESVVTKDIIATTVANIIKLSRGSDTAYYDNLVPLAEKMNNRPELSAAFEKALHDGMSEMFGVLDLDDMTLMIEAFKDRPELISAMVHSPEVIETTTQAMINGKMHDWLVPLADALENLPDFREAAAKPVRESGLKLFHVPGKSIPHDWSLTVTFRESAEPVVTAGCWQDHTLKETVEHWQAHDNLQRRAVMIPYVTGLFRKFANGDYPDDVRRSAQAALATIEPEEPEFIPPMWPPAENAAPAVA